MAGDCNVPINEAGDRPSADTTRPTKAHHYYDFRVGAVLRSETPGAINRLFVLGFPSREHAARFFADEAYLEVRGTHFDPAVAAVTTIAEYGRTVAD